MVHGTPASESAPISTGAVGMILTRVLSIDEAYRGVDWMTVFLLAGLIPLGLAFEKINKRQSPLKPSYPF